MAPRPREAEPSDEVEEQLHLRQPVKELDEKWKLVPAFLKTRGLVKQHTDSFNYLINHGLAKILRANERHEVDQNFFWHYESIYVGEPEIEYPNHSEKVTPHECRLRDLTYSAPIKENQRIRKQGQVIGRMPIMLRSDRCVLHNKSDAEMYRMKECPLDPGGYFVVRGAEKVVLIQEQACSNRILIEPDKNGSFYCVVKSSSDEMKTQTDLVQSKGKIYLKQNKLTQPVNVCIIFKALGIERDQEIAELIASEDTTLALLAPSLMECQEMGIYSQAQAVKYLEKWIMRLKLVQPVAVGRYQPRAVMPRDREVEVYTWLKDTVIAHVPVENWCFYDKAIYLGLMCRRLLLAEQGIVKADDRDYYGNKRMQLAGDLISLLFEEHFKNFNEDLKRTLMKKKEKNRTRPLDILSEMNGQQNRITNGMESAISSGNWNLKRFKMDRKGITEVLCRLSYISALGMMTRIKSHFEKTRKVSGPRALQGSQWGMLCPSDTPEGEQCGLVKNLALLAHVTTEEEAAPIHRLLLNLGVEEANMMSGIELYYQNYMVFLNGQIIGASRRPRQLIRQVQLIRRAGRLPEFVSVYLNEEHRAVYVHSDAGRLTRPLIIVESMSPKVQQHHLEQLRQGQVTFADFVRQGLIEYLDVNEENAALIAVYEREIVAETTHLEIEPFALLGVCAGLIPYPDHNQSPRNTYQCAMGKQAMGTIALNQRERIDTLIYNLVYPQKPLVKSRTIELIHFEQLPAGQNAIVAVMSYSGYDIEDALVLNKASLDRGYGRCLVFRNAKCELKSLSGPNGKTSELINGPLVDSETGKRIRKDECLDYDGIAGVGVRVKEGRKIINKFAVMEKMTMPGQAATTESTLPTEQACPITAPALCKYSPIHISKVMITEDAQWRLVKVAWHQTRRPELGDKFSSRHGQKGVTGLIVPQENMPFNEAGMCPDVIMNPHGYPSRMTVGKLMECIGSKAGALKGDFNYGTAFGGTKTEDMAACLVEYGYNYYGKDLLMSGETGEPMEAYIFMGPIYYQKLKHMVLDKMHARAQGKVTGITRQPTEGRSRQGGLRLGEMERDALLAYGASNLIHERLYYSSDAYEIDVCGTCGLQGYSGYCRYCRSSQKVASIKIPYACKLLLQELLSMNILTRIKLKAQVEK